MAPMASSQSSQTTATLPSQPNGACELQQQLRNMEGQVQRVLQELRRKEATLARERAAAIKLQVQWFHSAVKVLHRAVLCRKLWPCLGAPSGQPVCLGSQVCCGVDPGLWALCEGCEGAVGEACRGCSIFVVF